MVDLHLLPEGTFPNAGTSRFLVSTIDLAPHTLPRRPGGYKRISADPYGLERGVANQEEDISQKAVQLGWPPVAKWYTENDTSAYKKKRVRFEDGSVGYRNIRPQFMAMLKDLADGVIDGVIVYDQDRLQRQPRDLEDLIDLCEQKKFPVVGISSSIDLLTSQGRMQARIIAAFNIKSSEDTSRRVARSAVADARRGTTVRGGPRRYGWDDDAETVRPSERDVILEIRDRLMHGESRGIIALDLQDRNVPTATGAKWTTATVNTIMRNPRLAGIRSYSGVFHGHRRPSINQWWERTVKVDGEYVLGAWEPIMTPDEWEALQHFLDGRRSRKASSTNGGHGRGNPKHLLTGIVVCGECGTRMVGRVMAGRAVYGCRPKDLGGCNSVSRNLVKVDALVLDLAIAALRKRAMSSKGRPLTAPSVEAMATEIMEIERRKTAVKEAWRAGRYSEKDYFEDVAAFNAQIEELRARQADQAAPVSVPTAKVTATELANPDTPVYRKRALLEGLFERIEIKKSSRGPHFTATDIVPRWRPELAQ